MLTFQPGDIFGQLAIRSFLGAGNDGEIYAARHVHTDDDFALKVSHAAQRDNANAIRRALAAARGAYTVSHPNVVKVHDLGCEDDGMVWIRMELLQGCNIATLLAWQGRLSVPMALAVGYEAACALSATHEAQIVHRDVKPNNLFLVNLGSGRTTIKLLDFSIAKVLPFSLATTMGRPALGTPGYMAPEQIYGAPAHPCFDIYALGMTLWTAIAGAHPWQAHMNDHAAMVMHHMRDMPPSLTEVAGAPPQIDDLVRRALFKDPAARYPSMAAFAHALQHARQWLDGEIFAGRWSGARPVREPAIPCAEVSRAYAELRPRPAAPEPARAPDARVIVETSRDAREPEDNAATVPLGMNLLALMPERDAVIPPPPPARKDPR